MLLLYDNFDDFLSKNSGEMYFFTRYGKRPHSDFAYKIDTNIEGIIEHKKVNDGYKFVIDTNKLEVSEFLNIISENTSIDDIDIDSENLDNIIVKLYEDFNLWQLIYLILNDDL